MPVWSEGGVPLTEDGGPVGEFGGAKPEVMRDAGGAPHFEIALAIADVPAGGEVYVVVAGGFEDHGGAGFASGVDSFQSGAGVDAVKSGAGAEGGLHAVVDVVEVGGGHEVFADALLAGHEDEFPSVEADGGEHVVDAWDEREFGPGPDVPGAG